MVPIEGKYITYINKIRRGNLMIEPKRTGFKRLLDFNKEIKVSENKILKLYTGNRIRNNQEYSWSIPIKSIILKYGKYRNIIKNANDDITNIIEEIKISLDREKLSVA